MKQHGYGGPSDQTPPLDKSGSRPGWSVRLIGIKEHLRLRNTTSCSLIVSWESGTIKYKSVSNKAFSASSSYQVLHAKSMTRVNFRVDLLNN